MIVPDTTFHHGDQVIVLDEKGNYQVRGMVTGVHRIVPTIYDVLPRGEQSLAKSLLGLAESRLRHTPKPILSYERGVPGDPKYIRDAI